MNVKLNSTRALIVIYTFLLIIELFCCVPFQIIEVFRSNQNVPHTEVVGSGNTTIFDIASDAAVISNENRTATGKRVDILRLFIHVSLTTLITAFVFLFHFKNSQSNATIENLRKQNLQLQSTIDGLVQENAELLEYKKSHVQTPGEKGFTSKAHSPQKLPILDVNALAFADEETAREAQEQYAKDMLHYIERKIYN